ncbi:MAG: bifunctional 4-hydroxy-2-oxoglutarate aldolase/2-dehydro-3-deoxy-phosphogluconate aldolase [Ruminococcaceae bacterium]|nr:bifunctional 4-hydroxy-2-oxoglutarate aldolase/2-dehydro-3-deoxy-phosphogluconate aldolase [Oscillospiraceae bacterium]
MMVDKILNRIGQTKIVAAVRGIPGSHLNATLEALYSGGIRCVEITMDNPEGMRMLEQAKQVYGDRMLIGAGTVLDMVTARNVIMAGADYVLAPTLSLDVIKVCNTYGKLAVPGVLTPTEALSAWQAGAQLIKVFPVSKLGPQYIKDLLGPLRQMNLMPMGGVNLENAAEFMKAGAFALGVGSCLVNKTMVEKEDYAGIQTYAQKLTDAVKTDLLTP